MSNFVAYDDALELFGAVGQKLSGRIEQFSTMPNYTNFDLGTIIQYVGTTTEDYTNGYFYERTASGWVQKNTQPPASSLGTAAFLDVAESGDAASDEVVKGDDSRLSDSRPASDVPSWAKQSTKPTYNKTEVGLGNVDNTSDSTKKTDFTGSIASGNTGFVTGGDVYTALNNKVDKVTGKGLSTNDYTDEDKEKVDKIDVSSTSVSGNPLLFTTKSAQLAKNAEIVLEPIQAGSGDPSPTNIRAISGYNEIKINGCGKNLIDIERWLNDNNVAFTKSGNSYTFTVDSSLGAGHEFVFSKNPINIISSFTLVNGTATNVGFRYVSNGVVSSKIQYGTYIEADSLYFDYSSSGTVTITDLQIEVDHGIHDIPVSYEPYNPATDITLKLDETVYGGKLNVRSGELVVDRGIRTLTGSEEFGMYQQMFWVAANDMAKLEDYTQYIACNKLKTAMRSTLLSDMQITGYRDSNNDYPNQNWIYFGRDVSTVTNFKSWLTSIGGVTLTYPLATPYTIQLTPHEISLLLGDNVVTTNGTTINLDYNANGEMASLDDLSGVGESVNALSDVVADNIEVLQLVTSNAPVDITNWLSNLPTAIDEQNLEKYGYKIGDYFTGASGYYYYLADLDTFYGEYDYYALVASHHIGIIVDTKVASKWNDTEDISNVNYKDSALHTLLSTTVLNNIKSDLNALFGSWENHLVKHDKLYPKLDSWEWSSTDTHNEYISALTECQLCGSPIFSANNHQQGEGVRQLELFRRHIWTKVLGYTNIWLRSISTASRACCAVNAGNISNLTVTSYCRAIGLILFK